MVNNASLMNQEKKSNIKNNKSSRLSLNLHIMPKTTAKYWRQWLFLGLGVLTILALVFLFLFL